MRGTRLSMKPKHGSANHKVGGWYQMEKQGYELKCIKCDYCGFVGPFIGIDSHGKGACFGACGHGKVTRPEDHKRSL